jgi:hypothetical protein
MKDVKEIIYFRESFWQSVLSDTYMFAGIFGLLYFNHRVLDGSAFIDFIFIVMMFMVVYARASNRYKRFTSYEEMLAYLKGKK